jgi:crotonobetaine/carnitine-CoA ligase
VMFSGYWNRPEATLGLLRNLWLHTGDLGKFDDAGNFYFVDRKKDYLRRRGENISSYELESTFLRHPEVREVAVHAVASEVSEDDVKVTVVLVSGSGLTERELCVWAIERLPYFAVPRYVEFRDQLPKNPVGRVLKYQLREQGRTGATWDREESDVQLAKR